MKNPSPVLYALGLLEAHEAGVIDREDNPEDVAGAQARLDDCLTLRERICGRPRARRAQSEEHHHRPGVGPGRRLEEAVEMIYDITTPHDLRVVLGKPSITTEEVDSFIADADADPAVKLRLLEDVEPQGYGPQGDA